jgi:hypothetical protein
VIAVRARLVLCAAWPLAAGMVQAAPLGDNTVRLAPSEIRLPQNIGPLRYNSQRKFSDRRMGRSYLYNASGISLSLYVYDYGVANLPPGPDSVAACEQYESAKREIESGGNYENVRLAGEYSRRLPGLPESLWLREAQYEFQRNGIHAVSLLWLGSIDGFFFKFRLSLRAEVAEELAEARPSILAAIAQAVAARRRVEIAPPPEPQEATVEVDSHYDADAASLWLIYAGELVKFSREHPGTRPPCGGRLVPRHDAELAARRAALTTHRARAEGSAELPYWDELDQIERAGFLAEYSWHFFHDARDPVAPPHLDLAGFEEYRARELSRHRVESGARVRINTVRVLPVAIDAN